MHPLLAVRTPEQVALLDTMYEGRAKIGIPNYKLGVETWSDRPVWPTFQYVESTLHNNHGLNAREVLSSCPVIGGAGGTYGWVWHEGRPAVSLGDESHVALTIAGMSHMAEAQEEIRLFLDALGVMAHNERIFIPLPEKAERVVLSPQILKTILHARESEWDLGPRGFQALEDLLAHEPPTWGSVFPGVEPGADLILTSVLRSYAEITTPEEYVQRVIDLYGPPAPDPQPAHPSSLSLPEAIDYLNAVWRLRHAGRPLIRLGRVEVASKLALDCTTADEFESRLSALCSVLDGMAVPGEGGGKLIDLKAYLAAKLPEGSSERTDSAIDDLRAVFDLRVWRQHSGTDERAARGMHRLGLTLPAAHWGEAWQHVRGRSVAALSSVREEIELLSA